MSRGNLSVLLRGFAEKAARSAADDLTSSTLAELEAKMSKYQKSVPRLWKQFIDLNRSTWTDESKQSPKDMATQENVVLFLFDQLQMQRLFFFYQAHGHVGACLDPLYLKRHKFTRGSTDVPAIEKEGSLSIPLNKNKRIFLPRHTAIRKDGEIMTVGEIVVRMNDAYCHHIGYEYMHINDYQVVQWLRKSIETPEVNPWQLPAHLKRKVLRHLIHAHEFELFVNSKYPTSTKMSIEGFEMLMPLMQLLFDDGSQHGADSYVIGMNTPRGRLSILANILRKPLSQVFQSFNAEYSPPTKILYEYDRFILGSYATKVSTGTGQFMEFSLLGGTPDGDCIDPILYGKTKAQQDKLGDVTGSKVWPVIVHQWESFQGQGITYQTMRLSRKSHFSVGGAIHIVLTTQNELPINVEDVKCRTMPTNLGYSVKAPIFHVNSQEPNAVIFAANLATRFRRKFRNDVIINLIGYERQHPDEKILPTATLKAINEASSLMIKYAERLEQEEVVMKDEVEHWKNEFTEKLSNEFTRGEKLEFETQVWIDSPWKKFFDNDQDRMPVTGFQESEYDILLHDFFNYRPFIEATEQVRDSWIRRIKLATSGVITWYMAESLLFASFLKEGLEVRLIGQDVEDCVQFKRHQVLHSIENISFEIPIEKICKKKGNLVIAPTSHAEAAAIGYCVGYAQANPHNVVIWESAPGDTLLYALPIIDLFIANGEKRWIRQCGVICIIHHGIHGDPFVNAWPELLLQYSASREYRGEVPDMLRRIRTTNWLIVSVTSAANYFHVVRRHQMFRFRKPLLIFVHKTVAESHHSRSSWKEFLANSSFRPILGENLLGSSVKEIRRVLLCSGRVYLDLLEARARYNAEGSVAICRLEQLSPFPYTELAEEMDRYPSGVKVLWVQEEYKNQGWWNFVGPKLIEVLAKRGGKCSYLGKPNGPIQSYPPKSKLLWEKLLKQAFEIP